MLSDLPNYFTLLAAGLIGVETFVQLMAYKNRMYEEKAKNKAFDINELFKLEDEDD